MGILELFVLAIGLSMDAFAVSICKGLSVQKLELKHMLIVGAYFGGFQALMPAIGYLLGSQFEHLIVSIDHWIAFFLLLFIGGNMIKESRESDVDELDDDFGLKTMLLLAVATSIDALAVGVTFAFLRVNIIAAVLFIGCITFTCSAIGVKIGNV
ncbi:MAG: manganese efflux pump, partial [Peptococcaceae bacterium]|nr:manganese efflux pump [Peptococcaceae bacterium]